MYFSVFFPDLNDFCKTIFCFTFIVLFKYMDDIKQLHACNNVGFFFPSSATYSFKWLFSLFQPVASLMKPAQDQLFRPCFSQSSSFGPNTLQLGFTALDNFQNFFYKLLWKHLGKYVFKSTVFREFHSRAHKALESSLKGFSFLKEK